MKQIFIIVTALLLSACSLDEHYQTALNNYAEDVCKGSVLWIAARSIDGTTDSTMAFSCVEDTGVKYYSVKVAEIPLKYWELDKEGEH